MMNKVKLSQMQGKRVKVRPVARRIDPSGVDLDQIDEAWIIEHASKDHLTLRSGRSGQGIEIATDHVREFMSDSDIFNRSDGYLLLKSQILLFAPRGFSVQPL